MYVWFDDLYAALSVWNVLLNWLLARMVAQVTSSIYLSEHLTQARRVSPKRDSAEATVPGFRALA